MATKEDLLSHLNLFDQEEKLNLVKTLRDEIAKNIVTHVFNLKLYDEIVVPQITQDIKVSKNREAKNRLMGFRDEKLSQYSEVRKALEASKEYFIIVDKVVKKWTQQQTLQKAE